MKNMFKQIATFFKLIFFFTVESTKENCKHQYELRSKIDFDKNITVEYYECVLCGKEIPK